jgi:hypothetical protein
LANLLAKVKYVDAQILTMRMPTHLHKLTPSGPISIATPAAKDGRLLI